MRNRIVFIFLLIIFFSFSFKVFASEICSYEGYTILTVNGIFTDQVGAIKNKDKLKSKFRTSHNNQPLIVDYIYNATHLAGVSDLLDSAAQKLFKETSDYDLTNMLNDASQKVKTQKVLLVAHSQGNFYSNNFYDKVASKEGGVPRESIAMYGVATPSSRVAGGGIYLTSSTDKVINKVRLGGLLNVLPANVNLSIQPSDGNGHSFSDVYLKYKGDKIVSDIKYSLNKLQNNDEQISTDPCISPPKLTIVHKIKGELFAIADPTASATRNGINFVANTGARSFSFLYKGALYLVKRIGNFTTTSLASVFNSSQQNNLVEEIQDTTETDQIIPAEENPPRPTEEIVDPVLPLDIVIPPMEDLPEDNTEIIIEPVVPPIIATPTYGGGGGGSPITDTTAPIITILGDNPYSINKGDVFTDLGATATDDVDTTVTVIATGDVDTSTIGSYIKTYTATDTAGNVATLTRTVNVVDPMVPDITPPIITILGDNPVNVVFGTTYTDAGATALDDIDGVRTVVTTGTVDTMVVGVYTINYSASDFSSNISTLSRTVNVITDNIAPVITINGEQNMLVLVNSTYVDESATALDAVDGVRMVSALGTVNTATPGNYIITYTATDIAGNIGTATRTVKVSSYIYIPKYKFGTENGDGRDWQVWAFNGSNVYDWSDTYVDNYLKEQYKIQAYRNYWCSQCLQRGIFSSDPQKGFETVNITQLENNPQNKMNDVVYDVVLQWDSTGYTYTISYGGTIEATGHTNVLNIDENTWVGWDGSFNNFRTFPSGRWLDVVPYTTLGLTGGDSMVLQPYPVYVYSGPSRSSEKKITVFDFESFAPTVKGVIDESAHTVSLVVPFGTNVTALIPTITISDKASISALSGVAQDFTNPNTYTVTAENGTNQIYIVSVTIAPDSGPPADTTPPVISSLSISPSPIRGYAKIGDTLTLSIMADAPLYTAGVIKINNVSAINFTDNGDNTYIATYTVSSGDDDVKSGTIPVSVVLTDAAGNSNLPYTDLVANALKIDANKPILTSAKVASINTIEATFNEDIDGSTVNSTGSEFSVAGYDVTSAHELEGVVTLTLSSSIGAGETPSVTFTSSNFKDLAGNQAISPNTIISTNSL